MGLLCGEDPWRHRASIHQQHPKPAGADPVHLLHLLYCQLEEHLIKLDIINEVVGKTGITKTKAEMAVETVFEHMKKALFSMGTALSYAVSECST